MQTDRPGPETQFALVLCFNSHESVHSSKLCVTRPEADTKPLLRYAAPPRTLRSYGDHLPLDIRVAMGMLDDDDKDNEDHDIMQDDLVKDDNDENGIGTPSELSFPRGWSRPSSRRRGRSRSPQPSAKLRSGADLPAGRGRLASVPPYAPQGWT